MTAAAGRLAPQPLNTSSAPGTHVAAALRLPQQGRQGEAAQAPGTAFKDCYTTLGMANDAVGDHSEFFEQFVGRAAQAGRGRGAGSPFEGFGPRGLVSGHDHPARTELDPPSATARGRWY